MPRAVEEYLKPDVVQQIARLDLRAKFIVTQQRYEPQVAAEIAIERRGVSFASPKTLERGLGNTAKLAPSIDDKITQTHVDVPSDW